MNKKRGLSLWLGYYGATTRRVGLQILFDTEREREKEKVSHRNPGNNPRKKIDPDEHQTAVGKKDILFWELRDAAG